MMSGIGRGKVTHSKLSHLGAILAGLVLVASSPQAALAQAPAPPLFTQMDPPPPLPGETRLWPGEAAIGTGEAWSGGGVTIVRNVTVPTLTPFLPEPEKATGAGVIIAPGGAFFLLAIDHEGWALARWLQSQGIAAFVLKYRIRATPSTPEGFAAEMPRLAAPPPGASANGPLPSFMRDALNVATDDAQQAMRMVAARADEWNVDPKRVGFLGFSAGAMTSLSLAARDDPETRPAFVAPIYGRVNTPDYEVPASPPPMFAAMAADDELFGKTDFGLIPAWQAEGGEVEFHLYDRGAHGFGFPGRADTTTVNWGEAFVAWMKARGLLGSSKT